MARDDYFNMSDDVTGPLNRGAAVSPNDSTDLPNVSRALWVGTSGAITVTMISGVDLTLVNAQGLIPLRVSRVKATGTDATNIVALW